MAVHAPAPDHRRAHSQRRSGLRPVARLVRASHERWDGGGYPDRLAGAAIPLGARIIAACDAYEAITSERCYQPARSQTEAILELQRNAGSQFDPAVVDALCRRLMLEPRSARAGASVATVDAAEPTDAAHRRPSGVQQ